MTTEQAEALVDALDHLGVEASVYSNYSGRGMYGKTCTGIVCGRGDALLIGYAARDIGMDLDDLPRRTDSMGHGVIYY